MRAITPWAAPWRVALLIAAWAIPACGAAAVPPTVRQVTLESLAVPVTRVENRAVSFTNKGSAYFYTQTHRNDHVEHAWFRGLNIAGRRVFSDYELVSQGAILDPATSQVTVRPDALVRTYPNAVTETLRMFDHLDAVEITVAGPTEIVDGLELRLSGDRVKPGAAASGGIRRYVSSGGEGVPVDHLAVGRRGDRFIIAVGNSPAAAANLLERVAAEAASLQALRVARLEALVNGDHFLDSSDPALAQGLRWISLTTDQLVTRQRGDGIYAGLPWFNEYWGRDSFIALAGALLVTGQFEQARAVLASFAQFQDLDPKSRFYGRLPNIVKPESLDYHTTDGTPRWVIALQDYVRYSGDRTVLASLYPNIKASIEGALANWTDASGYLVHADNETWMDARREGDLASYSPRSTRANDIQALWHDQLRAGAEFAQAAGDETSAQRWSAAADRVRARFTRDFVEPATGRIADRLDSQGRADFTLRPNLMFALDLLDDPVLAARAMRNAWESLVYPWGVATLDARDPFFHPYHLAPGRYHKDEAYHNGTVWPWLNGVAQARMIDYGQAELAWRLFERTNHLALHRGVVGGLPETMDAYPHPGESLPRLTGTYLQAWSNAEHLRTWYEHFLGVRPDMTRGRIRLAPRLPAAVADVDFNVRVGRGALRGAASGPGHARRYEYELRGEEATLVFDVVPYRVAEFQAGSGDRLIVETQARSLRARLVAATGRTKATAVLRPDASRRALQAQLDAALRDVSFAAPRSPESHPVLQDDPPGRD
jgi:glycogen debranching enzyme